jgi:small redox-active disulfide protein 2
METPVSVNVGVNRIEVLGPGCVRCRETHRVMQHVVEQAKLDCVVEKNESVDRMVELGMLSTPGIAIDGRLVHQGSIPKAADVQRLLGLK